MLCVSVRFYCGSAYLPRFYTLINKWSVTRSQLIYAVFFSAALLAALVLPTLTRGDTYQQVEWVLLEAHSQLLEILLKTQRDNKAWIAQRSLNLSALIKRSTIPQNQQLMELQIKVTHFNKQNIVIPFFDVTNAYTGTSQDFMLTQYVKALNPYIYSV